MRPPYRERIDVGQTDGIGNNLFARRVLSGQLSLADAKAGRLAVKSARGANCLQKPVGAPFIDEGEPAASGDDAPA